MLVYHVHHCLYLSKRQFIFLCIRESQLSVTQANTSSFTFVLKWNNFCYLQCGENNIYSFFKKLSLTFSYSNRQSNRKKLPLYDIVDNETQAAKSA